MSRTPFLYRLGRAILGPYYKCHYKPKIIGKELIPNDGGIILAGNHIHLFDQCNDIISTKRFITYMAKKEYFDSAKTRWFFKSVGCIPVDRTKKDNSAVSSALDVLTKGGALGIFPEGTRNALKEDRIKSIYEDYFEIETYEHFKSRLITNNPKLSQIKYLEHLFLDKVIEFEDFSKALNNPDLYLKELLLKKVITEYDYYDSLLLPLKYGTVSMASKTNAKIVPVIITGEYKRHSDNLVVRFGKPFLVKNMSLDKANSKLRKEMINLIKQSLKESK